MHYATEHCVKILLQISPSFNFWHKTSGSLEKKLKRHLCYFLSRNAPKMFNNFKSEPKPKNVILTLPHAHALIVFISRLPLMKAVICHPILLSNLKSNFIVGLRYVLDVRSFLNNIKERY